MAYPDVLRMLHKLIAAPLIEQTPPLLGEAGRDVREAVNALLPNLLAAIVHRGLSCPSEATVLMDVLDSPRLDPTLPQANPANFFSGDRVTELHMAAGTVLLTELFGDRIHDMERAAADLANLKLGSGRVLLAMVAPFAFAVLRHAWVTSEGSTDRGSLVRLLHAQRHTIHPALQERFLSALGVPSAATWLELTGDFDAALVRPVSASAQMRLNENKRWSRALWLVPLPLLAVLLLLAYCSHHTPGLTEKAAAPGFAASDVPASLSQRASSATAASTACEFDNASEPAASSLESVKSQRARHRLCSMLALVMPVPRCPTISSRPLRNGGLTRRPVAHQSLRSSRHHSRAHLCQHAEIMNDATIDCANNFCRQHRPGQALIEAPPVPVRNAMS
ncbi:DUF937 domain-containing protein [Burkholderia sp. BE17]|uniref:DUF937 domain-containing protein n=1 Tax=Burkholderia sp. BE17 TaxID=2656644 RepID=UPI00128E3591|nr:DUF937 domain-containing protein [Burkholderia sp. BE17]MPV71182.1 hypothetical protein [Burkholderia sp. BE17]